MTTTSTIRQGRPPLGCTSELRLGVRPEVETHFRELAEFAGLPMTQIVRTFIEDALVSAGAFSAVEVSRWKHREQLS